MFNSYSEATSWINSKAKEYGSKNKFYASDEYREAYPEIVKAFKMKNASVADAITKRVIAAGYKEGDKVMAVVAQHLIFGNIYRKGTLCFKDGVKVILDESYVAPGKKRGIRTIKSPKFKPLD